MSDAQLIRSAITLESQTERFPWDYCVLSLLSFASLRRGCVGPCGSVHFRLISLRPSHHPSIFLSVLKIGDTLEHSERTSAYSPKAQSSNSRGLCCIYKRTLHSNISIRQGFFSGVRMFEPRMPVYIQKHGGGPDV